MKLYYFAWVRQKIGKGSETMTLPASVDTIDALIAHLSGCGPQYQQAFGDVESLKFARNQDLIGRDAPIADSDEIAIFPPFTGG